MRTADDRRRPSRKGSAAAITLTHAFACAHAPLLSAVARAEAHDPATCTGFDQEGSFLFWWVLTMLSNVYYPTVARALIERRVVRQLASMEMDPPFHYVTKPRSVRAAFVLLFLSFWYWVVVGMLCFMKMHASVWSILFTYAALAAAFTFVQVVRSARVEVATCIKERKQLR